MYGLLLVVFIGGALGAIVRECLMLLIPTLSSGFPLDIFIANVIASFLLGYATYHHRLKNISDDMILLFGAGALGGMSTFSSFIYGAVTEFNKHDGNYISVIYVALSLVVGFFSCWLGLYISRVKK